MSSTIKITSIQIMFIKIWIKLFEHNWINQLIKIKVSRSKYLNLKIINWNIKIWEMKLIELQKKLKILTNLWILTAIAIYFSPFLSSLSIEILSLPGACQEVAALPLYKPQKGADQGKEGQGQSLVNFRTVSHGLMDREAIDRTSGLHWMNIARMSGMLRYTQYILNQMIFKNLKI